MTIEHENSEAMSFMSELEVSVSAWRNDALAVLRGVLVDLATDHQSPVEVRAHETDFDGYTIILHLRISRGSTRCQADEPDPRAGMGREKARRSTGGLSETCYRVRHRGGCWRRAVLGTPACRLR